MYGIRYTSKILSIFILLQQFIMRFFLRFLLTAAAIYLLIQYGYLE